MDVSIPDSLNGFITNRVRSGGYPNADAYITDLVGSEAAIMESMPAASPFRSTSISTAGSKRFSTKQPQAEVSSRLAEATSMKWNKRR
jgi:Arc/MetJ-type ribon-helix-helix transcriptional regulator